MIVDEKDLYIMRNFLLSISKLSIVTPIKCRLISTTLPNHEGIGVEGLRWKILPKENI